MKRTPLRRRTRLRARSAKTAERDRLRRAFRELVLRERPRCELGQALGSVVTTHRRWSSRQREAILTAHRVCTMWSTDVHEVVKRSRGGSVLDPENVKALCRNCHMWTESEPALATELGFLRSRWTTG